MRNKFIFKGQLIPVLQVCETIFEELMLSLSLKFREISRVPMLLPSFFDMVARWRKEFEVIAIRWRCLMPDVVKLNTDGCSRGNPGRTGRGRLSTILRVDSY